MFIPKPTGSGQPAIHPKWMAATSPIVLLLMNFVIYLIVPSIGKYVMPIALNVGFSIFFMLSLTFGDTRNIEQHLENTNKP